MLMGCWRNAVSASDKPCRVAGGASAAIQPAIESCWIAVGQLVEQRGPSLDQMQPLIGRHGVLQGTKLARHRQQSSASLSEAHNTAGGGGPGRGGDGVGWMGTPLCTSAPRACGARATSIRSARGEPTGRRRLVRRSSAGD